MSEEQQKVFLASGQVMSVSEAAKLTPYSQEYLSLLARKGKLPAVKIARDWLTTSEAVLEYVGRQRQKHQNLFAKFELSKEAEKQTTFLQAGFAGIKILISLAVTIFSTAGFLVAIQTGVVQNAKLLVNLPLPGQQQKLTVSIKPDNTSNSVAVNQALHGSVLGESTTGNINTSADLNQLIDARLNHYLSEGKFKGSNPSTGSGQMNLGDRGETGSLQGLSSQAALTGGLTYDRYPKF